MLSVAMSRQLEGGPIWTEAAYALDEGCRLTGESNDNLGQLLPMLAGREGTVNGDTISKWRRGKVAAPFWVYLAIWRRLRAQGYTAGQLFGLLGFTFREN